MRSLKSTGAKCVSENSTGGKSGVTRNSVNPFESSRRDKPQYFVDVVRGNPVSSPHTSPTGVQLEEIEDFHTLRGDVIHT